MTLIVETGAGVIGAESYATVAEASTYYADRGDTTWALLTLAQQEQALRRATDYISAKYRWRWHGFRNTTTQTLCWPRSLAPRSDLARNSYYPTDVVPAEVKLACNMLARRAAAGDLLKDQGRKKTSVTVGPISTTYEAGSPDETRYLAVDAVLRPLLKSGGGQISMVRR